MRRAFALCLVFAVCSASATPSRARASRPRHGRIVGGETVDVSDYPWQVAVEWVGTHHCSGSIISNKWVLTAGRCLISLIVSVRAGTSTRLSGGKTYEVAKTHYHDYYSHYVIDYDVGVIQISKKFSFGGKIQAVSLATTDPEAGTLVTTSGWGSVCSGGETPYADKLQAVTTTVVSRDACNRAYNGTITERMLCAGEEDGGKGFCSYDKGGPLVSGTTQYGIASWGEGCAQAGYPGVYTSVATMRHWITEMTGVE